MFSGDGRAVRQLDLLAFVLAVGLLACAAAADERDLPCQADCVARELIARIPVGERVAVLPFGFPETGIPPRGRGRAVRENRPGHVRDFGRAARLYGEEPD